MPLPPYVPRSLVAERLPLIFPEGTRRSDGEVPDFKPAVGYQFELSAEWGSVGCEVLVVEPARTLSYSWGDDTLKNVGHWALSPTEHGTHLRMEQTGFRRDQPQYYGGAKQGWPRFLKKLEQVLDRTA